MTETTTPETGSRAITMSAEAASRIREMTTDSNHAGKMLRVSVSGGGCSGFQYGFDFDDAARDDDRVVERDGVKVLIDEVSWDFIVGGELHFVSELIGSYFTMRNPNATSTCGCGVSFAVG